MIRRLLTVCRLLGRTLLPPPPSPIDDPMLGRIESAEGTWMGEHLLPAVSARPVWVSVPGDATGPSDDGRNRFGEALSRLPELNRQVESHLFRDFSRSRRDTPTALPAVRAPQDVWGVVTLTGISVLPREEESGDLELDYGLGWDEGHELMAWFREWRLIEVERTRPFCTTCGYDLTGNVSGTCPECGMVPTGPK